MSPTLELQGAVVARLKAYPTLIALVSTRVFDFVPRDPATGATTAPFPFVSMGPTDELQDDADCIETVDISFQIDAWSNQPGAPEVLKIADAVRSALHKYEFTLAANAAVLFEHRQTQKFVDPSGPYHAVIQFAAIVELN
ncbi:MAG: DUF3168 domain-containing protein [Mesorhizobium sp.]|nr:MAG: DUF3168 domain-containing protein [Mesorhizobium sp.]